MGINENRFNYVDRNHKQKIVEFYEKWYIYISFLILIIIVSACSYNPNDLFGFRAYRFPAKSMVPTLLPGERILVDRQYYKDRNPQRGDIIVFEYPKDPKSDFLKISTLLV